MKSLFACFRRLVSQSETPEQRIPAMEDIPESTLGLHELYRPPKGVQPQVDVVAVHGLGGDSFSTWTDGKVLWLRELLPLSDNFKNARIMTFGYDAKAFTRPFAQSTSGRTFTFAESLLNDLSDWREEDKAEGRPIIFIGHSLGGIVIKAALRHARERHSMFHDILDSTKSILFFGTPHQGADSATWAVYLSKISGVVGVQNTEVTAELMRWSNPLVELTKVFSENQEKISITTFYESQSMHGIIVVPEGSATMGWKDERSVKLNGTHVSICKFKEGDAIWKTVRSRMNAVANKLGPSLSIPTTIGLDDIEQEEDHQDEGQDDDEEDSASKELRNRLTALRA